MSDRWLVVGVYGDRMVGAINVSPPMIDWGVFRIQLALAVNGSATTSEILAFAPTPAEKRRCKKDARGGRRTGSRSRDCVVD
jgi:hypothetical protein